MSDLAKYSMTRSVARSPCDSWASCVVIWWAQRLRTALQFLLCLTLVKMCSDVGYTISICAYNNARPSVRSARVDSPGRDSQSGWNTHDDRRTNTEEVNKFTCPNSATSCESNCIRLFYSPGSRGRPARNKTNGSLAGPLIAWPNAQRSVGWLASCRPDSAIP